MVLVNKWDAVEKDAYSMDEFTRRIRQDLNFMPYVPLLFISAKTGQRVDKVLPLALQVQEERLVRLTTSKINQIIHNAQDAHPAPTYGGRQLKMYYGTQVRSDPPTFMIYVNDQDPPGAFDRDGNVLPLHFVVHVDVCRARDLEGSVLRNANGSCCGGLVARRSDVASWRRQITAGLIARCVAFVASNYNLRECQRCFIACRHVVSCSAGVIGRRSSSKVVYQQSVEVAAVLFCHRHVDLNPFYISVNDVDLPLAAQKIVRYCARYLPSGNERIGLASSSRRLVISSGIAGCSLAAAGHVSCRRVACWCRCCTSDILRRHKRITDHTERKSP